MDLCILSSVNFPPLVGSVHHRTAEVEVNTTRRVYMDSDDSVSAVQGGLPVSDGNTGLESVPVSTNSSAHSFVSQEHDRGDNLGPSSAGSCD